MATMIVRAMKQADINGDYTQKLTTFSDKETISEWAKQAVGIASNKGIVNGVGENTFAPRETATRAQAAVMTYRLLKAIGKI